MKSRRSFGLVADVVMGGEDEARKSLGRRGGLKVVDAVTRVRRSTLRECGLGGLPSGLQTRLPTGAFWTGGHLHGLSKTCRETTFVHQILIK